MVWIKAEERFTKLLTFLKISLNTDMMNGLPTTGMVFAILTLSTNE